MLFVGAPVLTGRPIGGRSESVPPGRRAQLGAYVVCQGSMRAFSMT
jgi:hypothetical protein